MMAGLVALFGLFARRANAVATKAGAIDQPENPTAQDYMERVFNLRQQALDSGDQPFGAVIVKDGRIVGQSQSRVVLDRDPTGHAEMDAIRDAARRLGARDLGGCDMYSSSHPCPMCEAAAYWTGLSRYFHGRSISEGGAPSLAVERGLSVRPARA